MNQPQIAMLQSFIKAAYSEINNHKTHRDHASHRCMMYAYGRATGAYAMCGATLGADAHEKMQRLNECYDDAMGLTLL